MDLEPMMVIEVKGFLNSRVEAFTVGYEHVLNPVGRDGLTWSAWTGYRQGGHT